jgi:ubiquinone/menaquinone biosynthesis C-methylase UbiE
MDVEKVDKELWRHHQHDVWNRRSADYTKLDWVNKQDFMSKVIHFGDPQPHMKGLDIGSGPGVVAAALSPLVKEVVGIDISEEMIAKATMQHADKRNVRFQLANVEETPFASDFFNIATARMVFHHVADCARGLKEVLRVLMPGGRLVLCEGVPPDHLTRARYEDIFALKEERHTFSEAELINMFDATGFENIVLMPHFMRQVSLNNWLQNGALDEANIREIRRLHVEADDHFKRIYRLTERDGDVFMDWKFVIVRGEKPRPSS